METIVTGMVDLVHGTEFRATTGSGHVTLLDLGPAQGGSGCGARPLELLLLALASSVGMDVIATLREQKEHVTHFQVRVNGLQVAEPPLIFARIIVEHVVHGHHVSAEAVLQAIKRAAMSCPVSAMLCKTATVTHQYRVIDANGDAVAGAVLLPAA